MEYENTKKIERLQELLSKGYCKNPYTDQPMVSIDDFIEYVEKLLTKQLYRGDLNSVSYDRIIHLCHLNNQYNTYLRGMQYGILI